MNSVAVVVSERLARYGFGDGHPFGPDRLAAFVREFSARGLPQRVTLLEPRGASDAELASFHTAEYLEFVRERSASGAGLLDAGDTPAFRGVYEAAADVVGATLSCMRLYTGSTWLLSALLVLAAGVLIVGDWHFLSDVIAATFAGVSAGLLAGEVWAVHASRSPDKRVCTPPSSDK